MKFLHPELFSRYAMLVPNGDKLRLIYRSNNNVPRPIWGKPVPTVQYGHGTWACISNYVGDIKLCKELLLATKHVPHNAPAESNELRMSVWANTPALRIQLQWAIEQLEKPGEAGRQAWFQDVRTQCIIKTFNRLKDACPDATLPTLIQATSDLHLVGDRIVRKALQTMLECPIGVSTVRETDLSGRSPMTALRADPRYTAFTSAVNSARVQAYNRDIQTTFRIRDVLPRSADGYTLPTMCPVLQVPLDYTQEDKGRGGHAKRPFAVRVWRKAVTQGLTPANTTVMSSLATRMIEGRKLSDDTMSRALATHPGALRSWAEWRRSYTVATTAPGAVNVTLEDE